jgi:cell wall-associated NlpC family hydrolase
MDTPAQEVTVRQMIVAEAMTWLNTPYRQQGYVRGPKGAVDCSMLLVAAWVGSKLVEPFDPRPYPPNWFMHHSEERYLAWMHTLSVEVTAPQLGDIVLLKFGRCFAHSGIITNVARGTIVHSASMTGKCTLGELSDPNLKWFDKSGKTQRPKKYFDVWAHVKKIAGR